ncbi:hypothetical protein [Brevibacillus laterosporus]|uniref:hypothetical protein n=1 Tax=Brevibacillus laterosporus TaxID=1465 RepID=UPI003D2189C1
MKTTRTLQIPNVEYVVPKKSKYYGDGEYLLRCHFSGTKGSVVKAIVNVRSLTPNDIYNRLNRGSPVV